LAASLAPAAVASFFKLTSRSLAISTQITAPPALAISVFSSLDGETPSASAACMPIRSAFGS